ncbi:heptaprenyl diphosphate synthase [Lachnospiraceae bacterium PFB1-21]
MTKKISQFGLLLALAFILGYVERLVPLGFGIPGIKLGLANLVIVIAIYLFPLGEVFALDVLKVLLTGFTFGNMASLWYSLGGALLSLLVMLLLKQIGRNTVVGVSIAGGVFHNLGQLMVAAVMVSTRQVIYYLPVLLIAGLVTGFVLGVVAWSVLGRLKQIRGSGR